MSDTQGGARSSVDSIERTTLGMEQAGVGAVESVERIGRTQMVADPLGGGAAEDTQPARGLQR